MTNNCNGLIDEEEIKKVSFNIAGPVLFGYVNWVLDKCLEKNIAKVYFLARDGFILQKIAQKICKDKNLKIECRYLYCSRHSLRFPIYNLIGDKKFELIFSESVSKSLRSILKRVDLEEAIIKKISKEIKFFDIDKEISKKEFEEIKVLLKNNKTFNNEVFKKSKAAYNVTIDYFKQEKVFNEDKFVFVDSGWVGSVQKSFRIIFESQNFKPEIIGFYFGLYKEINAEDGKSFTYYFSDKSGFNRKVSFNPSLFECLLPANHGMTLSYKKTNKKVVPVLNNMVKENKPFVKLLMHYILQYCSNKVKEEYFINFKKELNKSYKILKRLITKPTKKEVDLFKNFYFCDDISEYYLKPIAGTENLKNLKNGMLFKRVFNKIFRIKNSLFVNVYWTYSCIVDVKPKIKKLWYYYNFKIFDFLKTLITYKNLRRNKK